MFAVPGQQQQLQQDQDQQQQQQQQQQELEKELHDLRRQVSELQASMVTSEEEARGLKAK